MNTSSTNLWDGLGGEQVLPKVVDRFVDLATTDPKVNYSRDGRYLINDATLRFSQRASLEFISAATGGPYPYSGKHSARSMRECRLETRNLTPSRQIFGGHGKKTASLRKW